MAMTMTFCGKMLKMKMISMIVMKKIMVRRKVRIITISKNIHFQRMLQIACK
jgi:hypothetical protein